MVEPVFFILKLGYIVDCFSVTDKKKLHSQDTLVFRERGKACRLPNVTTAKTPSGLLGPCIATKTPDC